MPIKSTRGAYRCTSSRARTPRQCPYACSGHQRQPVLSSPVGRLFCWLWHASGGGCRPPRWWLKPRPMRRRHRRGRLPVVLRPPSLSANRRRATRFRKDWRATNGSGSLGWRGLRLPPYRVGRHPPGRFRRKSPTARRRTAFPPRPPSTTRLATVTAGAFILVLGLPAITVAPWKTAAMMARGLAAPGTLLVGAVAIRHGSRYSKAPWKFVRSI